MQIENIKIQGMTDDHCASIVEQALKAVPGVNNVTVSLVDNDANVQYDENRSSADQLKSVIKEAGYRVDPTNLTAGLSLKNDS
ncbi:heavy-metal-associated domain-containing protein [Undibacterium sp. RuTC16W]|uniref:heavy-metal-associated domain-containing protein n=1 Tax=Undibacterium sp. RuTC16W TaxID=3413048 RepID=UPI003BF23964